MNTIIVLRFMSYPKVTDRRCEGFYRSKISVLSVVSLLLVFLLYGGWCCVYPSDIAHGTIRICVLGL